jgi:hypothetical protein
VQAHEDAAHGRGFSAAQEEVPAGEGEPLAQDLGELGGTLGRQGAQAANIGLGIGALIVSHEHGAECRLRGRLGGRRLRPCRRGQHQAKRQQRHPDSRHATSQSPKVKAK